MLLRLIEHPRIIVLLCYVLDCYRKNRDRWQQVGTLRNSMQHVVTHVVLPLMEQSNTGIKSDLCWFVVLHWEASNCPR